MLCSELFWLPGGKEGRGAHTSGALGSGLHSKELAKRGLQLGLAPCSPPVTMKFGVCKEGMPAWEVLLFVRGVA